MSHSIITQIVSCTLFIIAYNWKNVHKPKAASSATGECGLLCSFLCFDWLLDHCQNTSLVIWSACLSSSFKQMLNFYPNFHVIILLLVLMISRGEKQQICLCGHCSQTAEWPTAGQTVICSAVNCQPVWQSGQTRWPEHGSASETTCEPAGMYSLVGLCLGETSLTNRTLLGWGVVMAGAA